MIARLHQLAPWFDVPDFAFGFLCGAVLVMLLVVLRDDWLRERRLSRLSPSPEPEVRVTIALDDRPLRPLEPRGVVREFRRVR